MIKILFVCMGNICRSPSAQGIFEQHIKEKNIAHHFEIDSAGTHSYHISSSPDERAQMAAAKKGIDLSSQRARSIKKKDFYHYDYIIAMDADNLADLKRYCTKDQQNKLYRLLQFLPQSPLINVPDPYYEGDFDGVFHLIQLASEQLLNYILANETPE